MTSRDSGRQIPTVQPVSTNQPTCVCAFVGACTARRGVLRSDESSWDPASRSVRRVRLVVAMETVAFVHRTPFLGKNPAVGHAPDVAPQAASVALPPQFELGRTLNETLFWGLAEAVPLHLLPFRYLVHLQSVLLVIVDLETMDCRVSQRCRCFVTLLQARLLGEKTGTWAFAL